MIMVIIETNIKYVLNSKSYKSYTNNVRLIYLLHSTTSSHNLKLETTKFEYIIKS